MKTNITHDIRETVQAQRDAVWASREHSRSVFMHRIYTERIETFDALLRRIKDGAQVFVEDEHE